MPNFVWTAKDKTGKPVIREVEAGTIEESNQVLLAEGCTDLELKEDE
jgi:type II secretory pathway component PulF